MTDIMLKPVIDLHCDLLYYLELDKKRTPSDLAARCSIPQLRKGNVKLQIMAIFTETEPSSVDKAMRQASLYQDLPAHYPKDFSHFSYDGSLQSPTISTLMAIENASGFCKEQEPLQDGFSRLKQIIKLSKPLYISLTWNSENRFGGGALAQAGLKADGKNLLEEIDQQKIALDLSHASDALAYDVIDYIEGHGLKIPLIASHSNARAMAEAPRNLPDDIAREIFRRGGIVGFNLCRVFIGESEDHIIKHFAHWLELGGEDHLVFGTDFFNDADFPYGRDIFFENYQNASCYGPLLELLRNELKLSSSFLDKLSHQNALNFIKNLDTPSCKPIRS